MVLANNLSFLKSFKNVMEDVLFRSREDEPYPVRRALPLLCLTRDIYLRMLQNNQVLFARGGEYDQIKVKTLLLYVNCIPLAPGAKGIIICSPPFVYFVRACKNSNGTIQWSINEILSL